MSILGKPATRLKLRELRLDPFNPRLPEELQGEPQDELAVHMSIGFQALQVAKSIAAHGYFESEPMIAVHSASVPGVDDGMVVLEGNRRLTALLGLADRSMRGSFPDVEDWDDLADKAGITLDLEVPVVIADSRSQVTPLVGFRHIAGILAWQPHAQARYVADLVDDEGHDFAAVSEMTGVAKSRVASLYRDQAIAAQARKIGIDTGNLEKAFSLLTVAMGNTKLRDHIEAPVGSKVEPGVHPVPDDKADELRELLGWIFGDGQTPPKVDESRQLSRLGRVVAYPVGLKSLRAGKSLEAALQAVKDQDVDPVKRCHQRLRTALNSLRHAADDVGEITTQQDVESVNAILTDIDEALQVITASTEDPQASAPVLAAEAQAPFESSE